MVNRIQNLRKSKDFDITDRIAVRVSSNPSFDRAITDFGDYIRAQVLADSIEIVAQPLEDEIEIDDEKLTIEVRKQ